jgi:hypothetical protein
VPEQQEGDAMSTQITGRASALSTELRKVHPTAADKLEATDALYDRLHPDADGHRPLTVEEQRHQIKHAMTAEELQAAQTVEYGTWVATREIWHGTAVAYATGHPVPVSAVERYGYDQTVPPRVRRVKPDEPVDTPAEAPAARPARASKGGA